LPVQGAAPELRFADRRNGYVFVDKRFYATHDGGTSWRRIQLGDVLSVATGAGNAFLTSSRGLETSAVSADRWRVHLFGFSAFDVEALGHNVWVLGTDKSHERLARSNDGGRTFTTGGGPCSPDIGGRLADLRLQRSANWRRALAHRNHRRQHRPPEAEKGKGRWDRRLGGGRIARG